MSTTKAATPKPATKIQSLEGAILRALSTTAPDPTPAPVDEAIGKSLKAIAPRDKVSAAKSKNALPTASSGATVGQQAMDKMARQARELREQLTRFGLIHVETVRFRPQGLADRRLIVEYAQDPEDAHSVLMRLRPATSAPFPAPGREMLTTQEAADRLNVSRPYVTKLVDSGKFKGVERTQSGHRRIPLAEVERVHQEMRSARRAALDDMAEITQDLRARQLGEAKSKAKRRRVAKQT